jgi:pilus assembly protein CpaF
LGTNKVQGYFTGCDMVPTFYDELRAVGSDLDMDIFKPHDPSASSEPAQSKYAGRA